VVLNMLSKAASSKGSGGIPLEKNLFEFKHLQKGIVAISAIHINVRQHYTYMMLTKS